MSCFHILHRSRPMSSGRPVNMYQSHRQRYHSYAMSSPQLLTRSHSKQEGGTEALTRSLNQAFYTTSYQSNITKYAGTYGHCPGASHIFDLLGVVLVL